MGLTGIESIQSSLGIVFKVVVVILVFRVLPEKTIRELEFRLRLPSDLALEE